MPFAHQKPPLAPSPAPQMVASSGGALAAGMGGGGIGGAIAPLDAKVLASDPLLQVACVLKTPPNCSEAHLYLKNASHASVRNLSMQFEPPPSLRMSLQASPPGDAKGYRVTMTQMHGGSSTAIVCTMQCVQPMGEGQLLGQVGYVDAQSSEQRILSFKVPLALPQLLRPNPITTQQFGGFWPAHAAEKKQVSHNPRIATNPRAFMDLIKSLNFHEVEIIGMECISCGKLVGSDHMVLLHGKLGLMAGRAMELTVRSKDTRLTEAAVRLLDQTLK